METADKTIESGDNGGAVSMSPPVPGSAFDCEIIDCWLVEGGGAILKLRVPPSAVKIGGVYPRLRDADDNCLPVRVTLPNVTGEAALPARKDA